MINTLPFSLSNSLCWTNSEILNVLILFLFLDFVYFIFSRHFVSRLFLDNRDYYTFHSKNPEPILKKEAPLMWNCVPFLSHHSYPLLMWLGIMSHFYTNQVNQVKAEHLFMASVHVLASFLRSFKFACVFASCVL